MITLKTTDPCILSSNPIPSTLPDQATFDARYRAAQPAVNGVAGTGMQAYPFTNEQAQVLANEGNVVDVAIMCWNWSPYFVMLDRLSMGETWSPNANQQNLIVAPGVNFPGLPPYDPKNPPVGSISNSLNLADWPSFIPPPPPPVTPTYVDLIGFPTGTMLHGFPLYTSAPRTDNSFIPANGIYWNSRGEFQKIVGTTLVGPSVGWILIKIHPAVILSILPRQGSWSAPVLSATRAVRSGP